MDNWIQSALDDGLHSIELTLPNYNFQFENLYHLLSLVKLYYAFGKNWGEGELFEYAMHALEETVYRQCLEIHILSLTIRDINLDHGKRHDLCYRVKKYLSEKPTMILPKMRELEKSLYDGSLQSKASAPMEMGELLSMLESLIQSLGYLDMRTTNDLRISVEFSKNIIHFAMFCGLEQRQMGDMLIHVQSVLVDAARLISAGFYLTTWAANSEFYQLLGRIKPVEYHVCRMHVGILEEASKLSQSSNHSKPGSHSLMLDVVCSLISDHLELFCTAGTSSIYIFDHQVHSLYEALRFLRTNLTEQLYEKVHVIFKVFLCKARIIVSYLFVRQHNNHVVEKLQRLFFDIEKIIKLIKDTQDAPRYPLWTAASYFPRTNLLGFIDSVLDKMKSVNFHGSVVGLEKNELVTIHTDLEFLRSSLVGFMGRRHEENGKVQALWSRVAIVAYETEFVLDSLMVGGAIQSFVGILNNILEQIKLVKGEGSEVISIAEQITKVQNLAKTRSKIPSSSKTPELNGQVVGMDDESQKISDQLTRGTKQVDIVSIVGMAGLGKTTLAKKLYRHASIVHYFHVQAWCTVSQEYNKKRLLIEILSSLNNAFNGKHSEMSEDDLANAIRKHLKRKKYLIILDDVWDTDAWIV